MKKKIFIGIGVFLLIIIASLAAIPIFFKDQIKAKIEKSINENVDAKVTFADASLSLFKNFPQANVGIQKLIIINKAPFAGDTLVAFEELNLQMSVKELFNGENQPMTLKAISVKNGKANILFNKDGIGNFDIAIKDNNKEESKSKPFAMNIQNYALENFNFKYYDERSKIKMVINELNHTGTGNFAAQILDLDTKSTAKISLDMDKMNYMKNVAISLDAVLGIDLEKSKYTFKDNTAKINELPLQFNGFIQLLEDGQDYDLTFKTPTSSFKNFLGLVPAAYAGDLNTVKTTGDFTVAGFAKGKLTNATIPKFNIAIASNNASFQYPDLPKSVQNIIIDTKIINETGLINDTYVNLDKLSFKIDQDVFTAKANIRNVATNALVDAALKGTINLGNVTKAYPVKLAMPLSGILKADVTTKFDMKSVETSQYQNIQNAGNMTLTGFNYTGEGMAKPVQIKQAIVAFNPKQIRLNQLDMKTGNSDIQLTGTLDNFYGFLFRKQILKGNFDMNSSNFLVSDFMAPTAVTTTAVTTTEGKKTTKEAVKIPAFLDCAITAKANTVVYDNLTLKAVSGKMIIRDEAVTLQNIKTNIFDGQIGLSGLVSTKGKVPTFSMNLDLNKVDIAKTFTQLDMLKKIAPIAGIINGKLNSNIKLSGNLNAIEMTPDLNTISGDLLGQLLSTTVNSSNSKVLSALGAQVKFLDVSKLNLNDIKAAISFNDGKVTVKPFKIKYQDIVAEIGGSHGFDQNMNYNIKMDVPAKYLGAEVNKVLAKLTPADAAKIDNIPITALVTGNFANPKVSTDMKQASTNLASQILKSQKDKLINQGASALGNLLGGGKKDPADTTKTKDPKKEAIKNAAGDLLNGLFGKKK
ncbi:AsmA family protein [Flavobacterium psychrophilum]|uniref:AsmA-like C-terminal region-containing protein n=1 Tax=Flavobacterium psychrophilum TaxID=96345 RepID=UPI001C8F8992|nr:AsmA-like C-terminal region-containing protein [Flavobacterium psychrophilum]EKT4498658.1 AsmA family protein [Flavobacterium psychrophilum]ELM3649464.1 AsmA family protein [Flavobacterium psychrophilum]ELM3671234.1 AsmA family protein [Flavobacterium psychrophilum]ELM3725025.1 AsmA family protein [Flavobacterium psychrophilum]ELY1990724.1 AsmA family protein [Flavobacterium psychrophilum]